jgi:tRNA U34 5-carboxymethylaminomethyl modifying GTPase MnmE/TrmE
MDSDLSRFKHYTRSKQAVAREVRALATFLQKHVGEREAEECRQWLVKLAEDRFTLAVAGQFKRGKSSLINAIIGRDILPTGVLPLTSVITVLRYGPTDRLTILKEGSLYPEEVPISRLAEFVTENGNPGNVKKVAHASLELPSQFLRNGLEFVDTPGIGSTIEANTATTYGFLPQSDTVIFVTSVDTPLSGAETDFLRSVREHVRRIFFVVNKIDLVSANERQQVLDFISGMLIHETGAQDIRVFPISSTMALESKLSGNTEKFAESGLKALQEALSDFLLNEKSSTLLISVLDKVIRLADRASRGLSLLKAAGNISLEALQETASALKECFQALKKERENAFSIVRKRVTEWASERISNEFDAFLADDVHNLLGEMLQMLSRLNWQLSRTAVKAIVQQALPRFRKDLDQWTKQQTERFHTEIIDVSRQEWSKLERKLHRIPAAAATVLGSANETVSSDDANPEFPIYWAVTTPNFENIEWRLQVSFFQTWLPVSVVRHFLIERLTAELKNLTAVCMNRLNETLMNGIREVLDRTAAEIEKRAGIIESGILQAIKGKRLSKGIDGHWQLSELDREGLAVDIDSLVVIERKLSSVRSDMLEIRTAPDGENPAGPSLLTDMPVYRKIPARHKREWPENGITAAELIQNIDSDLNTRGCPVCNRIGDAVSRFLANWQYELATHDHTQHDHADALGFCPLHTWQQEAISSPLGLSQGLPVLMERLSAELAGLAASLNSDPGGSVLALVQQPSDCKVCRMVRDIENAYLKNLAEFLKTHPGQHAYTYSKGLCLMHLGMLLRQQMPTDVIRFLLEHAARRFAEISEDMQNYSLKRDALRGGDLNLDEQDAYIRGIVHHVGAKKVCFPWVSLET